MAKCMECGADDVIEEAVYCHRCGARIHNSDEVDPEATDVKLSRPEYSKDDDPEESFTKPIQDGKGTSHSQAAPGGKRVTKDEEHDIWTVQFSPKGMIGSWILVGVLCSICIIVATMTTVGWLIMLPIIAILLVGQQCRYWFKRMNHRYRLTSFRLLEETGIISRTVNRIELIDIEDLQVVRTLVDRMVGIGSIVLLTHDVSDPKLTIQAVEQVDKRYDELEQAVRKEKRRREFRLEQS